MSCSSGPLGLLELAGVVIGIYAFAWVLRLVLLVQQFTRLHLHPIRYEPIAADKVPTHLFALYRGSVAELMALGFSEQGFAREHRIIGFPQQQEVCVVLLRHQTKQVWAIVGLSPYVDRWQPVTVTFFSFFTDGSLTTMNGGVHGMLDVSALPDVELIDPYAPLLREQWLAHCRALAQRDSPLTVENTEDMIARCQSWGERYLHHLKQRGRLQSTRSGALEMTVGAALQLAVQSVRGLKRMRVMLTRRARSGYVPVSLPLEEEVALFERLESLRRQPARRAVQLGLFALTAVLFGGSMSTLFDPLTVVVLSAVVLLHEIGHYVAMRLFGIADATIFFLPFLGAATVGRRDGTPVVQELVILLAGPVPGLLAAWAVSRSILPFPGGSWQQQALLMLVVVNLFNLLPLFPLDGGKVLHALIFRRQRWLEAGFLVAAGLTLFALGLRFDSRLLALVGIAVGATVPHRLRMGWLLGVLRKEPVREGESAAHRVFRVLNEHGYATSSLQRKVGVARGLLQRSGEHHAGVWTTIAGMVAYASALGGALVLLVQVALPQSNVDRRVEPIRQNLPAPPVGLKSYTCDQEPLAAVESSPAGLTVYIEVDIPSSEQARALEGALASFLAASPRFPRLRPPWRATSLTLAQLRRQERARATYWQLQQVALHGTSGRAVDARRFYRRLVGCNDRTHPAGEDASQHHDANMQRVAAVKRYLSRDKKHVLDHVTAARYMDLLIAAHRVDEERALIALGERLGLETGEELHERSGATPGTVDSDAHWRPAALGRVQRKAQRMVLPHLWLLHSSELSHLVRYLCHIGVREVRWAPLAGVQRGAAPAAG